MQTEQSENIAELAAALALAQGEMKNPDFDKENPHLKSKYASLLSVRDAVMPVFAKHGISVLQLPRCQDMHAGCVTTILHKSGQWIRETLLLPMDKHTTQGAGAAITYAKRYSLQGAAGVVGEPDTDGETGKGAKRGLGDLISPPLKTKDWDLHNDRAERIYVSAKAAYDKFSIGEEQAAFDEVSGIEDQEEKMFLWAILKNCSKMRSSFKQMAQA